MPAAVLPGFGGLSFFTAVVQQQRQAHGYYLPVPDIACKNPHITVSGERLTQADAAESDAFTEATDSPEDWVQQTVQLTAHLGFAKQPLLDVAAAAPRSKAERSVNKRSWALLGQQVQPSAVPCSTTLSAGPAGQDGVKAAGDTQPPPSHALGTIAASYAAEFTCGRRSSPSAAKPGSCSTTTNSACSSGPSCPPGSSLAAGHVMGLQLDEPIMPAAGAAWHTRPLAQGRATLFCDPLELEELQHNIPDDVPQGAWDAAYTKVHMLPAADDAATQIGATKVPGTQTAGSLGAETPPTGAAPAVRPSIQHLVQAWVLQRHQQQQQHTDNPSTAPPAMCQGACPDSRPTAAPITTSTVRTSAVTAAAADSAAAGGGGGAAEAEQHLSQADPAASEGAADSPAQAAAAAAAAAELPGANGKAAAAPRGASRPQCKHIQVPGAALEEPALPCSWLQLEACTPLLHHTATGSHCPICSLAAIQAVAVAERADFHSSIATQEAPGCCLSTETEAATAAVTAGTDATCKSVGTVCLEVPGPTAASTKQVRLLLPAAVSPAAVPAVGCSSHVVSSSSQQLQANSQEGPAASKQQSVQQGLTQLVASWRMALSKPVGRRRWGADAAEGHVRRRPSLAVRPRLGSSTPKLCSNTPSKPPTPAPRHARPPAITTARAGPAQESSAAAAALLVMQANPEDAAGSLPPGCAVEAVDTRPQQQLQQLQQQEEGQCKEQQPASPTPPSSQEPVTQLHDDSCPVVLSPASLLIEVPVCLPQQPSQPVDVGLLQTALSAAAAVLRAQPAALSAAAAAEEAGHAGARSSAACLEWDASWGDLMLQPAGSSTGLSSAAAAWCTPAVMAMLSGEALQGRDATAMVDRQQGGQQGARELPGRQHSEPQQQQRPRQQHNPPAATTMVGHVLLQQLLAADMELGAGSDQLLPVVLFPAADDYCCADMAGGSSRGTSSICLELQHDCGYKQQSTVHLELYFDWSWLQPQHQTPGSKGSKRNSSTVFGAAALKRIKISRDTHAAAKQAQDTAGVESALLDSAAWLSTILQHPGLIQLQHDLQQRPLERPADGTTQPDRLAAGPGSVQMPSSMQEVAQQRSRQVFADFLQLPAGSCGAAASKLPAAWSTKQSVGRPAAAAVKLAEGAGCLTGSPEQPEAVPQEVAAAAAAWRLAQQSKEAAATTTTGPTAAAAVPTKKAASAEGANAGPAPGAAPATDLDFFMQVQGAGLRQHKRRFSSAVAATSAAQLDRCPAAAAAPIICTKALPAAEVPAGAVQQVSLSCGEPAAAKRPRLAYTQQQQQQGSSHADAAGDGCQGPDLARHQQRQDAAHVTTDLALTGALRGADAAQLATAEAGEAAAAAGPVVITAQVSSSILQLLLQLDTTRQQLLSGMQCPGPELVECPLWQDAAAQQLLLQLKARQQKQQQEAGKGPTAQQRQHNKQLVVLVLLSQTAACLLHYGIKVAHMFLQHGLQRLPSVSDACRPSLLALSAASEKLEQPAVPRDAAGTRAGAAGTASSSCEADSLAGGEHPKLARLLDLVLQLKSCQPDCRLLLVSESKAFFNLYHTLSAAGIIAVQFDRDRKLQTPHAAAGQHRSGSDTTADPLPQRAGADPAQQAVWQQSVLDALAAAHSTQDCCCVLATHEQLHDPCMPLQEFRILIEYVAFEDTAAGTTAAAAAAAAPQSVQSGRAAVQACFGSDRHFVFKVQEPDLAKAASRLGEAAVQAAAAPAAAVAHAAADSAAAATAFNMGGSYKTPAGIKHLQQTAQPDAATAPAAAVVHGRVQSAAAQHAGGTSQAGTAQDTAAAAAAEVQAQELPLVLNVSPGSLIKHRQPLYQSLLQLEAQGYVLVERCLSGSRGNQPPAAVDVVLTPRSCLCIWDDRKLPQEADAALQCLSRSVLALSMAYDSVFFVLELQDSMLQAIIRSSSNLQGLARAVGVRLQLLTCFTAANTQDAVLHICQETVSNFWASADVNSTSSSSSSSSNANTVQPPQGISDLPTPAEAQLATCCALNPLSAAVLVSQGATLQTLFQLAVSGEAAANPLLQVCLPERSLQLLQVQASVFAACIEQHRKQQEEQLLQPSQEDDYCQHHQQQQQYGQQQQQRQGAWHRDEYCTTGPQDLRQQRMPDTAGDGSRSAAGQPRGTYQPPDQQQWQQHSTGIADQPMQGASDNWQQLRQQQHWQQQRQQQQQQHWQQQPPIFDPTSQPDLHAAAAGCSGGCDMYDGVGDLPSGPTLWQDAAGPDLPCQHTDDMQAEPQWMREAALGNAGLQPGPDRRPVPVDQLQDTYVDDGLEASESVDPSRVLDDFLLSRRSPRAAAAGGSTARYSSARPMQPGVPRSSHWAQQHGAAAAVRAGHAGDVEPLMVPRRQHTGQQRRRPHAGKHRQQVGWGEAHTNPHECYPEHGHVDVAEWEAPWAAAGAADDDEGMGYQAHCEPKAGGTDFLEVQHGGEVRQGRGFWGQQQPGHQQWFDHQGAPERQQGVHINQPYSRGSNMPSWAEDGVFVDPLQPQAGYQVRQRQAYPQQQQQVAGMFQQPGGFDSGPTGDPTPRHTASRGGMFAAAVRSLRDLHDDSGEGDGFATGAAASPPLARHQAFGVLGAAAAAVRRPAQRDAGFAGGPPAGRGSMLPAQRRPGAAAPSSSNGSGLTAVAVMPHHNPSKQLKYKLPAAAAGVAKRKKAGRKGGFQTKLFWG